jgi:hypothetical protein
MFRSLLLAALLASTSLGCAIENGEPADGPVAGEENSLIYGGGDLLRDPIKSTARQRFDFVLTAEDARTCDSFTKVVAGGSWRGFSTFPTAPQEVRDKRCAAVYTPNVDGGRATVDQLGLNCREGLTARERLCGNYGTTCATATYTVMRAPSSSGLAAKDIASACPIAPKLGDVAAIDPGMYALTYTGGCTSCGTISGGMLYLNSPNPWGFVTYNNGGTPYMVGFNNLSGPITYNLGGSASGPVMVSY